MVTLFRIALSWLVIGLLIGLGIPSPGLAATKTSAIVSITGENTTTTYGNVTALHALVTGSNPGGLVTFKEGTTVLGTANLDENNTAHLVKRLDIGIHDITAAYSGDAYNTANISPKTPVTINKALSTFNWSFGSYYPAVGVAFPITIAIVGFDATPPTGTLSLAICKASCSLAGADIPVGTAQTLVNGTAAFSYTPTTAGDVTFIATYSGDARNQANTSVYAQRFPAKATPAVSAYPEVRALGVSEPVNVTTRVFGANATGSVQLNETVNGVKTTLATCTLVSGTLGGGTCTSKLTFSTAGTHVVTPTYTGDTYNNTASDGPISFTVSTKHIPKLSLAIFPNPVIEGQPVTAVVSWQGYIPSPLHSPGSVTLSAGTSTYTASLATTNQKGYQQKISIPAATGVGLKTWSVTNTGNTYNSASTATFIQEVLPSGSPIPNLDTWNYGYDAENNLTTITDPDGDLSTRHYDGLMRLTSVVRPDPVHGGASTGPTLTVTPNLQGQTTGFHDGRVQTTYDVDGLGRVRSETSLDITRIDRVYDDLGRPLLIQPTAPALPRVNSFDEISRLTRIDYTGGIATEFTYDGSGLNPEAQGQLTHLIDESGTTDVTYSAFGEVTSKTQRVAIAGLSKTHIVRYGWGDTAGNAGHLTSVTYPSGSQVEYVYGTDGRITQVLFHPVLANGSGPNTATASAIPFMSNMQWTAWGALKSWNTQAGLLATRTYDTNGRLTRYPYAIPAYGSAAISRTLTYDTQGRVTRQAYPGAVDRVYAYDALDRLTGLVDSNPTRYLGYAYDTSNNRTLSQTNNLQLNTTISPGTNRPYSVEQWSSAVSAAGAPLPALYYPVHDNAGRLTDDGFNQYVYSDRGRLASVRNSGGTTSFLYNGLEQRVAKSGPLGTFFYVYDEAGHVLGEYTSTGAPLYEVIWLGDIPVGTIQTTVSTSSTYSATLGTLFVDHLNTPHYIFNTNRSTLWFLSDDPYAPVSSNFLITFNLRMPGQIFDQETGLFHNGHRDYNPATGRYIQPDPIGLAGGINRYAYVGGNPVSGVDPLGLFNAVKGISSLGNAVIAGFSAGSGGLKIAVAIGLSPGATTGVGALPPTILAAWGTWNLKSASAAWKRARQQWGEAVCEKSSDASWKNLMGMLPGGTSYDDPGEFSGPIDYIQSKGLWKYLSEAGYF